MTAPHMVPRGPEAVVVDTRDGYVFDRGGAAHGNGQPFTLANAVAFADQRNSELAEPRHRTYQVFELHRHQHTYPRRTADGRTLWACCESAIGPVCGHLSEPAS